MYKVEKYFTLFTKKFVPGQIHHFQEAEDYVIKELLSLGKISTLENPAADSNSSADDGTVNAVEQSSVVISAPDNSSPANVQTAFEGMYDAPGEQHTASEEQTKEGE